MGSPHEPGLRLRQEGSVSRLGVPPPVWRRVGRDRRIALDTADADAPVPALVFRGIAPDAAQPGGA